MWSTREDLRLALHIYISLQFFESYRLRIEYDHTIVVEYFTLYFDITFVLSRILLPTVAI